MCAYNAVFLCDCVHVCCMWVEHIIHYPNTSSSLKTFCEHLARYVDDSREDQSNLRTNWSQNCVDQEVCGCKCVSSFLYVLFFLPPSYICPFLSHNHRYFSPLPISPNPQRHLPFPPAQLEVCLHYRGLRWSRQAGSPAAGGSLWCSSVITPFAGSPWGSSRLPVNGRSQPGEIRAIGERSAVDLGRCWPVSGGRD